MAFLEFLKLAFFLGIACGDTRDLHFHPADLMEV